VIDPLGYIEVEEAVKLANMYRLFGHDSRMIDPRTNEERRFYAASRECVVDPSVAFYKHLDGDKVIFAENIERPGRHYTLPSARSIRTIGEVVLMVQPPYIDICRWREHKYRTAAVPMLRGKKRPVQFTVPGGYSFQSLKVKAQGYVALPDLPAQPEPIPRPVAPTIGLEQTVLPELTGEVVGTMDPMTNETVSVQPAG